MTMGKRKAKRKVEKRVKEKLAREFNCVFCNHENAVSVKIDQSNKTGVVQCRNCAVGYQTSINGGWTNL
ncbi:transcription elongation factor 1 [Cladochytrium replicatum]|nr:transcription elongation factor 1 [Cladochytrium replicatum]